MLTGAYALLLGVKLYADGLCKTVSNFIDNISYALWYWMCQVGVGRFF